MRTITIDNPVRNKYGLSLIDYCVLKLIYFRSNNQKFNGWCIQSKPNMAKELGIGRTTTFRSIDTLLEAGLVIKQEGTGYLRHSELFTRELENNQYQNGTTSATMTPDQYQNGTDDSAKLVPDQCQNGTLSIKESRSIEDQKEGEQTSTLQDLLNFCYTVWPNGKKKEPILLLRGFDDQTKKLLLASIPQIKENLQAKINAGQIGPNQNLFFWLKNGDWQEEPRDDQNQNFSEVNWM